MKLLCDTGASVSILRKSVVEQWSNQPKIIPVNTRLLTVTGETVPFFGKANVDIKLGNKVFKTEMLIAEFQQDGILGMDFMTANKCDLLISKRCLNVNGEQVTCFFFNGKEPVCCRVAVTETVEILAHSEIIVNSKPLGIVGEGSYGLIEPDVKFTEKTGLLVAKVLVDPSRNTLPIRIANFGTEPCKIFKNTVVAEYHPASINDCIASESKTVSETDDKMNEIMPKHLIDMFERSSKNLSEEQINELRKFLIKNQDVFSRNSNDIGHTTLTQHTINTKDAQPIRLYPYRIPLAKRKIAEEEIKKMAETDIIEKCPQSPWNAPVVMVNKPDGSVRFCCDFRRLNDVTVKDSQPLPRIDDSLDALSGSKWWSCLDMKSGYWQCEIKEEDRPKTAFSIPGGEQWMWKRMAFGLCNAPATFTRLTQIVFSGLIWKTLILYLDDLICFSKTFEGQLENLTIIFERLRQANLKLNPKKCYLLQKQVSFLGHLITESGVGTLPEKIQTINEWPVPRNAKQTKSFVSLCSYYRSYVHRFADIAKPLHQMAEKNVKFKWTAECQSSFDMLKQALTKVPILAFPTENDPFILDCDASNIGQGAVLSQVQDGREKVICYFSKCFSKPERQYCVTRRELLAIVNAIKHFHNYLYGRRFTVRTDHGSLRWLLNFKLVEGQLARWLTFLSAYDNVIEYRQGKIHNNADALSRRPCHDILCKYCDRLEERCNEIMKIDRNNETCKVESVPILSCNVDRNKIIDNVDSINCKEELQVGINAVGQSVLNEMCTKNLLHGMILCMFLIFHVVSDTMTTIVVLLYCFISILVEHHCKRNECEKNYLKV